MRLFVPILALAAALPALAADGPELARRLNDEAIALVSEGKLEEAIAKFTRARSFLPADPTLRKNLATARAKLGVRHLGKGEAEEAVRQLRLAASLDPGLAVHHANLGIALVRSGRADEGRKSLVKALLVDDDCAPAHSELGSLEYREGNLRKSIEHWEKACAFGPARKDLAKALARATVAPNMSGPAG